jgi:hypothetical protein
MAAVLRRMHDLCRSHGCELIFAYLEGTDEGMRMSRQWCGETGARFLDARPTDTQTELRYLESDPFHHPTRAFYGEVAEKLSALLLEIARHTPAVRNRQELIAVASESGAPQ